MVNQTSFLKNICLLTSWLFYSTVWSIISKSHLLSSSYDLVAFKARTKGHEISWCFWVWGNQGSSFSELHPKSPSRWEPPHKCPISWEAERTQCYGISHKSRWQWLPGVPMLHCRMRWTSGFQGHSAMPISSHPCWLAPSSSWKRELPCSPSVSRAWQPSRQQGLTRLSCDGIAYKPPPAPNPRLSQALSGSLSQQCIAQHGLRDHCN